MNRIDSAIAALRSVQTCASELLPNAEPDQLTIRATWAHTTAQVAYWHNDCRVIIEHREVHGS